MTRLTTNVKNPKQLTEICVCKNVNGSFGQSGIISSSSSIFIPRYYYMWKTTDRYVQQKRVKAVEAESKLKQVYIPNYNKPNPAAINPVSL